MGWGCGLSPWVQSPSRKNKTFLLCIFPKPDHILVYFAFVFSSIASLVYVKTYCIFNKIYISKLNLDNYEILKN
jgi:hypothetical protein